MRLSEFIDTISNSNVEDWTYDDDLGRYVYIHDIRITIISDRNDNDDREFHEEWATGFPDIHAVRARFYLCFNGNIIEAFYTAAVDGYRMLIPYTEPNTKSINQRKYNIGRILNIPYCSVSDRYDDYLRQAGIMVIGF